MKLRKSKEKQQTVELTAPNQWSKSEVRRTFRLDVSAAVLFSVYNVVLVSFPAILIRQQGAASWIVALVIAAPSIGNFSAIFWSRLTEKMSRMRVMLVGGLLARLSLLLMLLAFNPLIFALVMVLCNILEISKAPSYAAIMQQVYPNNRRGELMGKVRVAISVATIIAATAIGQLLQVGDFRLVYAGAGLFGIASTLAFSRIHYYGTTSTRPSTPLKRMLLIPTKDRRYGAFLGATFLLGFANLMGLSLYPIIAVDKLHISNSFYGILTAITSGLSIIFYFIWGTYSDRHHPMLLTFISFALAALNFIVYLVAWDALFLIIPAAINGVANAGFDLALINNAIRFPKEREDVPHYLALYTSLVGIRGVVAPFLVSFMLIFLSVELTLAISFIAMLIGLLNFYVVMRRLLRDPEFGEPLVSPLRSKRGLFRSRRSV